MSEHDEKRHKITHPKLGEAQVSEHQIEEFEGLGWKLAGPDPRKVDEKKSGKDK